MNDVTVIQRLFVLFLAGVSCQAYAMWAKRRRTSLIVGQRLLPRATEIQRWTTLFLSALHPGEESDPLAGTSRKPAGDGKASTKGRLSVAGDWLAPIIVWFLVITMGLAIVGFLLGER